jgi:zinc protease
LGDTQIAGVAYHIPAASHSDYAACEVLMTILGMEPSGPLYQALVETGLASSVNAMNIETHDPGMLLAMAETSPGNDIQKVASTLISEVEGLAEKGIDEASVNRAVKRLMKDRERQLANSELFAINLSEWQAYGDWRLWFLHRDRLEKVTVSDVQRVAADYCVASNRTLGLFLPEQSPVRAPLPTVPDVNKALAGYAGREKLAEGEVFEPECDVIQRRTVSGTLSTGVKYALLPKKTRGERIYLQGRLHYGNENTLKGMVAAARMLPQMLLRGTKQRGFQEFKDRLDELSATMNFSGEPGTLSINIQTKREHLSDVLDLLREALREPALDEKELDVIKRQFVTQMESMKSDPQALAATEIRRRLDPYSADDVRYTPTVEETIAMAESLKIGEIEQLYQRFLNGQYGEIAAVGDFELQSLIEGLENTFDQWTSEEPYMRIENPSLSSVSGEHITLNTPDKKNAVYVAGLTTPTRDDHVDHEALIVGNYILGGGPLSSRLADRVRKQEGLSYGVGSQFRADSLDERAIFMLFAISNPENSKKVVSTIDEELTRLFESGVTEDELARAKESFLKNRKGNRAQENRLVGTLLDNLQAGRTMEFQQSSDDKISSLNKQQVDDAMRRHFPKNRLVIITAGDFQGDSRNKGDSGK